MHRRVAQVISILLLVNSVAPSAIPIWELLTYEEKMGRLMYLFVHLVQRYCKTSPSNDCRKIMTLHGISNLLNYDEHTLDLLDPDQRNASELVWQAATKSRYKFPPEKSYDRENVKSPSSDYELSPSDSNDEPQRVVVPAPKHLFPNRRMIYS
ncbi:uncharacterized protein CDAR_491701 [Caerostris darwini]|uniref:Uncharacterized protein n=1 Tax=Caerostris darwini TaxID=1538125 RepID=A0AAV4MZU9_9ARAC|nr:uncharacterized protein CDAR_491701 [Caerostris darwini]